MFIYFFQVDFEAELHLHLQPAKDGDESIEINEEYVNQGRKFGPTDFQLKRVLGKGGYGKVFQVNF